MRTKKSLINMFVGFGGQGLSFIISFVNRVFITLPVCGIFGCQWAVWQCHRYAVAGRAWNRFCDSFQSVQTPENDRDQIRAADDLYKQMYRRVAVAVAGIGMALFPFLDHLVKGAVGAAS